MIALVLGQLHCGIVGRVSHSSHKVILYKKKILRHLCIVCSLWQTTTTTTTKFLCTHIGSEMNFKSRRNFSSVSVDVCILTLVAATEVTVTYQKQAITAILKHCILAIC